jgi:hypothetical protein
MKPAPQLTARTRVLIDSTGHGRVPAWPAPAGSLPDRYRKRDRVATSPFYTSEGGRPESVLEREPNRAAAFADRSTDNRRVRAI